MIFPSGTICGVETTSAMIIVPPLLPVVVVLVIVVVAAGLPYTAAVTVTGVLL